MKEVAKIKLDPTKDPLAKRFINLCIQRLDMNDARKIIQLIIEKKRLAEEGKESMTTAQYLFIAFVVTYYRCFTGKNERGKIDNQEFLKLLNEDQRLAHDELHHLRNKYMAHQDETPHISLDIFVTVYQDTENPNQFKQQFDYVGQRTTLWNDNLLGLFTQLAEIAYSLINQKTSAVGEKLISSKMKELQTSGQQNGLQIDLINKQGNT